MDLSKALDCLPYGLIIKKIVCVLFRTTRLQIIVFLLHGWKQCIRISGSTNSRAVLTNGSLQWRHNGHCGVSNHQYHDCLINRLFRCTSKEKSKLRITGRCAGNSPVAGEFPAERASNAANVSIWWSHYVHRAHTGTSTFYHFMNDFALAMEKCQLYSYADGNSLDSSLQNFLNIL